MSDAAFARRHRFPEVLEKRSKRRERERLVHERFKLKHTIDRLRNEASSAAAFAVPGRAAGVREQELDLKRRQDLAEAESTLRRLDELLQIPATAGGRAISSQQLPGLPEERAKAQARATKPEHPSANGRSTELKIRLSRNGDGLLSASASTASLAVLQKASSHRRGHSKVVAPGSIPTHEEPDAESLFATPSLRDQHFRPLIVAGQPSAPIARKSVRSVWAWGCPLPEAACSRPVDFDFVGEALADQLGRS